MSLEFGPKKKTGILSYPLTPKKVIVEIRALQGKHLAIQYSQRVT